MTYGELKLQFYFSHTDRHGTFSGLPASLYFAVVELANEAGCGNPVNPFVIADALLNRGFSMREVSEVLSVAFSKTQTGTVQDDAAAPASASAELRTCCSSNPA